MFESGRSVRQIGRDVNVDGRRVSELARLLGLSRPSLESLPGEEWRSVPEWEGLYSVSNLARVRRDGGQRGSGRPGMLVDQRPFNGYVAARFFRDGKRKTYFVHALVAAAFIGPRPDGLTVNHIDGNKRNNLPHNLEYLTCKENVRHAHRTGLAAGLKGERHPQASITDDQAAEAKRLMRAAWSDTKIADHLHTTRHTIANMRRGQTWRHVPWPE